MATIASLNVLLGVNSAQFQRGMERSTRDVRRFQRTSQGSFRAIAATAAATFGVFATGAFTRAIADSADQLTNITNQVRAAGVAAGDLANVQSSIVTLADETRASLSATGGLYARILRSSRDLGVSQEQALQITRAFQQTLALSGAETSEAAAAALQFGQALASGRLQGDELRSILENNSFFAQEFARELGVGVGQLREMGAQGQLTSELLADVALRIAPRINQQFEGLSATFAQAGTVLQNRLTLGFGELGNAVREALGDVTGLAREIGDRLQGALAGLANTIRILAANGEAVMTIVTGLAGAIGTLLIPRILALATLLAGQLAGAVLFLLSPIGSVIAAVVAIGTIGAIAFDPLAETAAAVWDRIRVGAALLGSNIELLFVTVKDGVVSIFQGIANGIIDGINFAIRQLNRASNALGGGNIADELSGFSAGSDSAERIRELRAEINGLRQDAEAANMSIATGIGNVGGVLGDAVDSVTGLVDQLFGQVGTLPGNTGFGSPGLTGAPAAGGAPTGEGLIPEGQSPFEFSQDQRDRLGQSVYDGIDAGLRTVLSGEGSFSDFANSVLGSIQGSLVESLAGNFTDFISEQFGDFFEDLGDTISEGLSSLGGGGLGGIFGGLFGGIFHDGGIVPGRSGQEVPILAQAGEAVLTQEQQRALFEGRGAGGQTVNQTIQVTGDVTEATRRAVREMSGEIAQSTRSHFVEQGVVS